MIAMTRDVSPSVAQCELTHLERIPVDYGRAVAQHRAYRELLASLGYEVIELPGDAAYPDCVFIEDTAVVLGELAVITRPGAESRRGETEAVAAALARYRDVIPLGGDSSATLDGGDVLVLGETIYAGRSRRTNDAGIAALRAIVEQYAYDVVPVDVTGCLHLKSAVTRVSREALLVNRSWFDATPFERWTLIDVDEHEPAAANALLASEVVLFPSAFSRTRGKLEAAGISVRTVDADELAKAEGGVTCCALLI